jgi:uncharacterized membrane protein
MSPWLSYYWVATLIALGLAPFLAANLRALPDRGWSLARAAACFGAALLDRWLSGSRLLIGPPAIRNLVVLFLLAIVIWTVFEHQLKHRAGIWLRCWIGNRGRILLRFEILHFSVYLLILQLFTIDPSLKNTERPSDAALLMAEATAEAFPAKDPWLSKVPLSYYSLGHRAYSLPIPWSVGDPITSYPLAFALAGAGSVSGLTSFALALIPDRRRSRFPKPRWILLSLLAVLAANPQACYDGWKRLVSEKEDLLGAPWWWRASRIVKDPPTAADPGDRVSEFLLFTLRTGDLHAHFLALPLGLLTFSTFVETKRARDLSRLAGIWAGLFAATVQTHPWDLPRFLLLFTFCLFRFKLGFVERIWKGGRIVLGGACLALPGFGPFLHPPWTAFQFVLTQSHWSELLLVWGAFVPGWILTCVCVRQNARQYRPHFLFLTCGVLLAATSEFVYLSDGHSSRFNTFFKLSFSAYPLLLLSAVATTLGLLPKKFSHALQMLRVLSLTGLLTGIPYLAGLAKDVLQAGELFPPNPWRQLAHEHSAISEALQWVRRVVPAGESVVQGPGESYREETVYVSVYTGRPHPLGWWEHEIQWRGPGMWLEISGRKQRILELYQATSSFQIKQALRELDSRWVWVGPDERDRFPNVEAILKETAVERFNNGLVTIWELRP